LPVGSTGATATAYYRNYEVSAVSDRDVARILGEAIRADGDHLIALHDTEVVPFADAPDPRRGITGMEGRIYFDDSSRR
jgi:hypothetical protein